MAFCVKCGTDIGTSAFCSTCGTPNSLSTTAGAPVAPVNLPTPPPLSSTVTYVTNAPGVLTDPVTGQPLCGWWRRAGASAIDWIVLAVIALLIGIGIKSPAGRDIAQMIIGATYFCAMWLGAQGRTLGNMAVSTRVILTDASPITSSSAVVRWATSAVPRFVLEGISANALSEYVKWQGNHRTGDQMPTNIQHDLRVMLLCLIPYLLWRLADIVSPLIDRRRRTIHDIFARTIVVRSDLIPRTTPPQR